MPTTLKGQPIDQRTDTLGLPLPHIDNWHEDDVPRLRSALAGIDAAMAALLEDVAQKADAQTMAQAIENLQGGISSLGVAVTALINNKVGAVNGLAGPAVTLRPAHLGLGPANGPSEQTIVRDAQGRIASVSATTDGKVAEQTLQYDAHGRVATVTTTYDGRRRTESLTYNAGGLVSVQATEESI